MRNHPGNWSWTRVDAAPHAMDTRKLGRVPAGYGRRMPAEGIHLTALREAMAAPDLDASARRRLVRHDDAARFGAILPDLPYFDRYASEVVRYVVGASARPSPGPAKPGRA